MTREEAIKELKVEFIGEYDRQREAKKVAIKALEQDHILDKIKAEIEQCYCTVTNDYDHGRNYGLYMTIQIIDKYKAESEVQKNDDR